MHVRSNYKILFRSDLFLCRPRTRNASKRADYLRLQEATKGVDRSFDTKAHSDIVINYVQSFRDSSILESGNCLARFAFESR